MCTNLAKNIATALAKWETMTITSDPLFGMVMENKEICLELINRALPHLKAKKIIQLVTQKDINVVAARRVRYDVYVRDEHGNIIVIEMQVADKQNLPYRLRYYQEQIDHGVLLPGKNYQDLSDHPTYVIMFCDFDYYGRGWARYTFENTCLRDSTLKLGDQRTVVVFNALAKEFAQDEEPIKTFLALMRNQVDNRSKFITKIQNEIVRVKQDPERRRGFMKFELELMDARREGIEKGETKGIYALIHTLRDLGIDEAVIKQKVMSNFNLSDADATKYLQN
ncbi:Rpn family recombination-promoting nuclease/putative transposase [Limosilactobacillus walteri]|uniref:Rpn family recombination-promoting nuclease/putative transposase n=1 Tax=Limosilactobacillus walteri TaxID=2268022 RepID=A0ABR8P5E5_9LACO|nr:Rpn family recombination-promoting nuclease/putative transposase [Limosilactobacillus walteri]MBD5805763.1 Rpn family recombination-promoting nuclease/putative transposase [Limosilactobacillus walteri]